VSRYHGSHRVRIPGVKQLRASRWFGIMAAAVLAGAMVLGAWAAYKQGMSVFMTNGG
jgi:hypothetical protein